MRKVVAVGIVLAVVLVDQLTKTLIRNSLFLGESISLAPFFHITHVANTGAAFGILPQNNIFFILVSLSILGALLFFRKALVEGHNRLGPWGLLLIVGGAIGNLIDRFLFGAVTDFLDFRVWPVFNVADSCITIGIGLMFLSMRHTHVSHPV